MQEWLSVHGIVYPECTFKHERLALFCLTNPCSKYAINVIAKAGDHKVILVSL